MRKIQYFALMCAFALGAATFTACEKGEEDGGNKQIELPDQSEQTQQAYADEETTGGGFTFVAKSAWTAAVAETTPPPADSRAFAPTRAANVPWLRLLIGGEETYSGGAGEFTMTIELDPNYTGKTRSATITITCGGVSITITVTQQGTDVNDNVPEGLLDKHELVLHVGESATIRVNKWGDTPNSEDVMKWESDNTAVATVAFDTTFDQYGTVTAVSPGTAYITMTMKGGMIPPVKTDRCRVTVLPAEENPDPKTFTIKGEVTSEYGNNIAEIRALQYYDDTVLGTGTFSSSGAFSITLPVMKNEALRPFDLPGTITLSDNAARQTHVNDLEMFDNSGVNVGHLVCHEQGNELTGISQLMYVDRNCLITGNTSVDVDGDGNPETIAYSADLKKGWNIVYAIKANGNYKFTTTKPDAELKWYIEFYKDPVPDVNVRLVRRIDYYTYMGWAGGTGNPNPGSGTQIDTYEYTYDEQNRLTNVKFTDGNDGSVHTTVLSYSGDGSKITIAGSAFEDEGIGTLTALLNPDGSIASISAQGKDGQHFTYSGGYLKKSEYGITMSIDNVVVDENGEKVGTGTETTYNGTATDTFTWNGSNNLASIVTKGQYPDAPGYNWSYSYEFSYGNTPNAPTSIDMGFLFIESFMGNSPRGWFGKSSAYLPTIIKETDGHRAYPFIYTTHYRYETDGNGYPLKIYEREKREDGTWLFDERVRCRIEYYTK